MVCPLCKAFIGLAHDKYDVRRLISLYMKSYKINVDSEYGNISELKLCHCHSCDLKFFMPALEGSDSFYSQLSLASWYYEKHKPEYERIRSFITLNSKVLDVGCGLGYFSDYLTDCFYTGLEYSSFITERALNLNHNVINISLKEYLGKNVERYNYVCAFQVLEHIANINEFIHSCIDALLPNGHLIIAVPSHDSYVGKIVNGVLNYPPHHLTWWSNKTLTNIPKYFDLKLVQLINLPLTHDEYLRYSIYTAMAYVSKWFGIKLKSIDLSILYNITMIISLPMAFVILNILLLSKKKPNGHTVLAIYKKLPKLHELSS